MRWRASTPVFAAIGGVVHGSVAPLRHSLLQIKARDIAHGYLAGQLGRRFWDGLADNLLKKFA